MHGASIEIDAVTLPASPALSDVAWYGDVRNPTLRATLEGLDVFVTSTPDSAPNHRATIRVLSEDDTEALFAHSHILPNADGVTITGQAHAKLLPLIPLLRFYGTLPDDVAALDGTLAGPVRITVPADAGARTNIHSQAALNGPISLTLQFDDSAPYDVTVESPQRLMAGLEYPSMGWQAEVESRRLTITGGGLEQQRIALDAIRCESGIRCRSNLQTTFQGIAVGGLSIATATLAADDLEIESAAGMWTANSDSARLQLTAPAYAGRRLVTPSIEGDIRASNERLETRLRIATPEGGVSGSAEIIHNLAEGRGGIRFDELVLDIEILHFSEAFEAWPYEWDVTSGSWQVEGDISWQQTATGFKYQGRSLHTVDSLAGSYGDVGFLGFSTQAELSLGNDTTPVVAPGSFELGLVDIRLPDRGHRRHVQARSRGLRCGPGKHRDVGPSAVPCGSRHSASTSVPKAMP